MSSRIQEYFQTSSIRSTRGSWPLPSIYSVRNLPFSMGVTFRKDPGYLRLSKRAGEDRLQMETFATKATLRKEPVSIKFEISQTLDEFTSEGLNSDKLKIEHELEGEDLNRGVHLLRAFTGWINSSGSRYARSSILA